MPYLQHVGRAAHSPCSAAPQQVAERVLQLQLATSAEQQAHRHLGRKANRRGPQHLQAGSSQGTGFTS
jgi:hypothetical protein